MRESENYRHLHAWKLQEDELNIDSIRYFETVMCQSNGYIGTRASFEELSFREQSTPLTLIAGLFDKPDSKYTVNRLAPAPNWTLLNYFDGTHWFSLETGKILDYTRSLSFADGILKRTVRWQSPSGRVTKLVYHRFISMARPHVCAISVKITPENYDDEVIISSQVDCESWYPDGLAQTDVISNSIANDIIYAVVQTKEEGYLICESARTKVYQGRQPIKCRRQDVSRTGRPSEEIRLYCQRGQTITVEKLVTIYDSLHSSDPAQNAKNEVCNLPRYSTLESEHRRAFAARWAESNITIEGDNFAQAAARFFVFHLLQAESQANIELSTDSSIAAKMLSGHGYNGHVFWDTEIYLLPFYSLEEPELAEHLIRYRYNRLKQARLNAQAEGRSGAKFPWESAGTGIETTPKWVWVDGRQLRCWTGEREIHVTADVAYGVWQHYISTGNKKFLDSVGTQIILETARYWGSRAEREDMPDGSHHYVINNVIPPNEHHECVNNSFYTNALARWNLLKALELVETPAGHIIANNIGLTDAEKQLWKDIAESIVLPYDTRINLYEESEGYFDLETVEDVSKLPIGAYNDKQVTKQADVLLALYLLPELSDKRAFRRHYDYYVPRTTHQSSLSPGMHVLFSLAAGYREKALEFFKMACSIDAVRRNHASDDGLHAASLGGGWQAIVFGFGGVKITEDGISISPDLPDKWKRLQFSICYRGRRIKFDITQTSLEISNMSEQLLEPLSIKVQGRMIQVDSGSTITLPIVPGNPAHPARLNPIREHRFEMMIFDWDGTAVPNRNAPIGRLKSRAERLLADGFVFAVVTGTHLGNIWNQFVRKIRKSLRKGIIVCCNRGSEVYRFDETGRAYAIFKREAAELENRIMDEIALEMQSILAEKSIASEIVWDRMNRRKIDLLPGWEVEKSEIGEALAAVQSMFNIAGIPNGIKWATDKLIELAEKKHLKNLCLTSDVKHLEFGLTDKSHSVSYLVNKIAPSMGIETKDIIFLGDEFGEVGGFIGSDSLMILPDLADECFFVSVGKEPNGVPENVIHYRRGHLGFQEILDIIAESRGLISSD